MKRAQKKSFSNCLRVSKNPLLNTSGIFLFMEVQFKNGFKSLSSGKQSVDAVEDSSPRYIVPVPALLQFPGFLVV
jgi:hypothetical protein